MNKAREEKQRVQALTQRGIPKAKRQNFMTGAGAATNEQIGGVSPGNNEATIENGVMTESQTTTVTTTKSFASRHVPNPVRASSTSNLI